jgi:hypothetical protein
MTPSDTPDTDEIVASISVDRGVTFYDYVLSEFFVLNNCVFLRGDVFNLPVSGDNSIIFKILSSNTNDIKINDISVGVSY